MATGKTMPRDAAMGRSLLWTNLLSEPLFTLYGFIAFILYKDLQATPLQIALLTMLKPLVTILSFYWSAELKGKCRKLKPNVLWAGFLMRAPFLLCPFFDSAWYVIFAAVNYMFFYRAQVPGWLEIIKRNMSGERRGRLFSLSAGAAYAEGVILSLGMGALLDQDPTLWKALFFVSAIVGLCTLWVQGKIPVEIREEKGDLLTLKERIVRPWKDSLRLMRERPDFATFQWGFMIAGFGIMLIQPALPLFAVDTLGISYLEMVAAISIAKGLGFALSSPIWGRLIEKKSIFQMASLVFFFFGIFPFLLASSSFQLYWLYIAYFFYGIGQGGSHLVWNLSGPIFSGQEESSRFSGVNVVLAGLRGAIAPPLGSVLAVFASPFVALGLGGLLCFYSGFHLLRKNPIPIKS